MGRKHRTEVTSDDLENNTVTSSDISDGSVTGTDISDKSIKTQDLDAMEHGSLTVGASSYVSFGSPFAGSPDVVLTGINAENLQLSGTPAKGSFSASAASGTADGMWMAWGSR